MFSSSTGTVNDLTSLLYDVINNTFEKFVPRTQIRLSDKPRWYTKQLAAMKNNRNKIHKKLSSHRLHHGSAFTPLEEQFLVARADYDCHRKQLFSNYLRDQAACLKNDPKSFWRHINSKRASNNIPAKLNFKDKEASSDKEKAGLFADFFKTVYCEHDNGVADIDEFIRTRRESDCYNISFTTESVHYVLSTMNLSKGSGHDGVSPLFLRECADTLAGPLCSIFNKSMIDGVYPEQFKIGQITPIFKNGKTSNVENYRGVNVLPGLAEVFERLVYNNLKLIVPPKLSPSQHGFVSNRNIETNLMETTIIAHKAFEEKCQLDMFLGDISKAFNVIDIIKLVLKTGKFKVSNAFLRWLYSYLSERKQYVKIGASQSDWFNVTSGVGQGTILGPLLFNIFFDDSNIHVPGVHISNFADDKKLMAIIKNQRDALNLQRAIDLFVDWCDSNGLKLNQSKCKVITFHTNRKPLTHDYSMKHQTIERVKSVRDLGVILDEKLQFDLHIEYISKKAMAALQFVKRQAFYFDKDIIKILYMALVRSNLEFASSIWAPHQFSIRKYVERAQKQIVMLLNGDHLRRINGNYVLQPYVERCEKFGLTTLVRRRANASILFIHSIISGKYNSPYLLSQIKINKSTRTLRNPEFIYMDTFRTDHSWMSPFNNACRMFNNAALFIDPTIPHHQFRKKLLSLPDAALGTWVTFKPSIMGT